MSTGVWQNAPNRSEQVHYACRIDSSDLGVIVHYKTGWVVSQKSATWTSCDDDEYGDYDSYHS